MVAKVVEFQAEKRIFFRPLGRPIRGTVDLTRPKHKGEYSLAERWPEPVPGLILGVDLGTGEKYIRDPLYDPEHYAVRTRIERYGHTLPPERERFDGESVVTWLYWLAREVKAGSMRVVAGEIPPLESFDQKPRLHFIRNVQPSDQQQLAGTLAAMTKAIEQNSAVLAELLKKLGK